MSKSKPFRRLRSAQPTFTLSIRTEDDIANPLARALFIIIKPHLVPDADGVRFRVQTNDQTGWALSANLFGLIEMAVEIKLLTLTDEDWDVLRVQFLATLRSEGRLRDTLEDMDDDLRGTFERLIGALPH